MSEQPLGRCSLKSSALVCMKFGPSGSKMDGSLAGSKVKIFLTSVTLVGVNLDMDPELEDVPTMMLLLSLDFSVVGRILCSGDKVEAGKNI